MKTLLKNFLRFLKWHNPTSVAEIGVIQEHFNLSNREIKMLEDCISHNLIKEYALASEDRTEVKIVLNVSQARKLINMKRRNEQYG